MRGSAVVVLLCVFAALACHVMTDDARAHAGESDTEYYCPPASASCHSGDDADVAADATAGDRPEINRGDQDAAAADPASADATH